MIPIEEGNITLHYPGGVKLSAALFDTRMDNMGHFDLHVAIGKNNKWVYPSQIDKRLESYDVMFEDAGMICDEHMSVPNWISLMYAVATVTGGRAQVDVTTREFHLEELSRRYSRRKPPKKKWWHIWKNN